MKKQIIGALMITIVALGFRLFLALRLPNDEPDDGRLYALMAGNILEHGTYTTFAEEPYSPTYIRVPGYTIFVAGVYRVFGKDNNRAVRVMQAVIDSFTCWMVALLAVQWAPAAWSREKRRRVLLIALAMAAACPYTAIYVTTILTEVCATFLGAACALAAAVAIKADRSLKSVLYWLIAGLAGGLACQFRPDAGLFVAAAGATLAAQGLYGAVVRRKKRASGDSERNSPRRLLTRTAVCGLALSIGFVAVVAPWTIRNARTFGVFQPLAPPMANMPDEFVPFGYIDWLRTWVDSEKYTAALEWPMELEPVHIEAVPDFAFDSEEERARVGALLDRYNHPPSEDEPDAPPAAASPNEDGSAANDDASASEEAESSKVEEDREQSVGSVLMTPEIDAEFEKLARERIARHPIRSYVWVPLKRAFAMWFDTHSQYYPFQGDLFPLEELDTDIYQHIWLPLFLLVTILYTALALGGVWVFWSNSGSRLWILFLFLFIVPRMMFLSTLENPEPRYTVEFFGVIAAAGSLAVVWISEAAFARLRQRTAV